MVTETAVLVALIGLIDRIPMPAEPVRRGRRKFYPDRLFLKALVIMIVKRLPKVHSLLAVLAEPGMTSVRSCSPRVGAIRTGAPSSDAFGPFPRDCRLRSPVWVATSWPSSIPSRTPALPAPSIARSWLPKEASGTRSTERPE